jgi:thiamine transport system permease protein
MLWVSPLFFVAVMFYWPVMEVSLLGISGDWLAQLENPKTINAIWFTLWQALVSTIVTVLVAIPGAHLLYKRSFPGQRLVMALITVPFVLPSIVVAIGFSVFWNVHEIYQGLGLSFLEDPVYWIIAAHVFVNYSIAVKTIGGVWATLDLDTEAAAELDGAGRLRALVSISLPQLRPAIYSASALIFLFSATSFGIVLVLGGGQVQTIETAIFFAATQRLDLELAAILVLVQTVITTLAFLIGTRLSKGAIGLEQVFELGNKPRIDGRDLIAVLLSAAVWVGLIALPLILVMVQAFSSNGAFGFENFSNLGTRGARNLLNVTFLEAAGNSLRNMLLAAFISFVLGTLISWLLVGTKFRFLDLIFLLPLGVSSVVLGLGFLVSFDDQWFDLRSSWVIVPLAQALIAMPMVIRLVYPALVSIGKDVIQQAQLDGATSWQTWRFIQSKMIRSVLVTALGFAGIVSLGEFGASSFLANGSEATIPILLYRLISRPGEQNYGMAMAVSAILILLSGLVVYLLSRVPKESHEP